jgi:hypothetical protein
MRFRSAGAMPMSRPMDESATPPPDLFDEAPLHAPVARVGHVGAIATVSLAPADAPGDHVALRWRVAAVTFVLAAAIGYVSHFPIRAIAVLALFVGAMTLRPLPTVGNRAWMIAAASFFFAQATSIFVTPFTWPMRFAFCAVLLAGLALVRVNGSE